MGIARLRLLVACILWVMCWSGQKANGQQGVGLTLNGVTIPNPNNSIVAMTDIGFGAAALACTTTYTSCCNSGNPETQWYFPNGSQVPNNPSLPYQRHRGQNPGRVILSRNFENTVSGFFRCDIPDTNIITQSLYVWIYTSTTGVDLTLNSMSLTNNSIVTNTDIGTGTAALICVTVHTSCCNSANTETQWYLPDGSAVPNNPNLPYQGTREENPGRVILSRNSASTTTGIFQCDIPDASGAIQSLYVGIYTSATGQVTIPVAINFQLDSYPFASTPDFTLTCTSTGGPATTVSWRRGSTLLSGTSQIVTNTEIGTYDNKLRVAVREVGVYTCTVSNSMSSYTRSLTVVEADPPTNTSAVQVGPTSIRVSWTAPTPPVVGYRLSYFDGTNRNDVSADASATDHTMTIPQPQSPLSYTITIIALSSHLPSTVVNTVVTVVPPPTPPTVTPGAVTPTSVVISWSQQASVDSYEISFQRATGNQQMGECSSFVHSDTIPVGGSITMHNLTGLQEFSTYLITVTAVNGAGRSQNNPITVNTQMAAPSGSPQSLREVETSSISVTIAWDAVNCIERNSNITGYVVRYTPPSTSGTDSVMVAGTGDAGGMVTIDGLTPSTQYSVQVAAVNSDGSVGVLSTVLSVQTLLGAIPGVVSSLSLTSTSLLITWDPPLMPNGVIIAYEVRYQGEDGGQEVRNVTSTSVELTGLRPESTYTISVRAYTAAGPGMERILTVPATIASTSQALESGSLAGAVVGACIGTALLYTVVILVVKFAVALWNKRHREIQGDDTKGTHFDTDIPMKECVAYEGVAVHSGMEGGIYEDPQ